MLCPDHAATRTEIECPECRALSEEAVRTAYREYLEAFWHDVFFTALRNTGSVAAAYNRADAALDSHAQEVRVRDDKIAAIVAAKFTTN